MVGKDEEMSLLEIFLIGIGLSMDAFAVSICKGLSLKTFSIKHALIVGLYFGGFQALMPLLGYGLGVSFRDQIESFDHWVAFILLVLIGINMIREALSGEEGEDECCPCFNLKVMLVLAIATSIDALAVGVTFAFLGINILLAIAIIGATTLIISIMGVKLGNMFGTRYKSRAELLGGSILILIGVKILLEHLGYLNF